MFPCSCLVRNSWIVKTIAHFDKCWESVWMDFMTYLPKSKGFDPIIVVVDRVSKMEHFVRMRDTATAQEIGQFRQGGEAPRDVKKHHFR